MLPSKAANPPRITAKISTIAGNVSSIWQESSPSGGRAWRWNCPAPPRQAATWRTGPGRASAAASTVNLQRVPDRSAARRQNLASSGLPNRQCVHCFILPPQYRWSVESIRLLARATEASVLHAAPVVQPETTSPCLTYSMPRNAQVRRHHAMWGTPNYDAPVYGRSHSLVLGQNAKHTADRPI